jgi:hypothetical protein
MEGMQMDMLRNFAAFWNFILLLAVFATLGWFFYYVFLRKILRVRRIASRRSRRIMREAATRESQERESQEDDRAHLQVPPDTR